MQVIEKLPSTEFETICDAGVELLKKLFMIMDERGIGLEHAASVLAVCAAGATKGNPITPSQFASAIDSVSPYWRSVDNGKVSGVVFDPAHRRDGYVIPDRETGSDN